MPFEVVAPRSDGGVGLQLAPHVVDHPRHGLRIRLRSGRPQALGGYAGQERRKRCEAALLGVGGDARQVEQLGGDCGVEGRWGDRPAALTGGDGEAAAEIIEERVHQPTIALARSCRDIDAGVERAGP
jgi:hypothetical protein